jgi:hypothetical protein
MSESERLSADYAAIGRDKRADSVSEDDLIAAASNPAPSAEAVRHDDPMVMTTGRNGNWVSCRCGWVSRVYEDRTAAQHEWALHVRHNDGCPDGPDGN